MISPIAGTLHCGTCSGWRWWCWGLFNLSPLPLGRGGWCGARPSSRWGLWAWRRPACVHAAWDAPLHTGSHRSVHPRCRSPTGKQTEHMSRCTCRHNIIKTSLSKACSFEVLKVLLCGDHLFRISSSKQKTHSLYYTKQITSWIYFVALNPHQEANCPFKDS